MAGRDASREFRVAAERRWPAVAGILIAIALYALPPSEFANGIRWVVGGIAIVILLPLVLFNPVRLNRESRISRWLSVGVGILLLVANQVVFVQLVVELVAGNRHDGPGILLAAVQAWATNIIAFSVAYWEMDRGGPVARRRDPRTDLPDADFRFPQDENADNIEEVARSSSERADWMPALVIARSVSLLG